MASALYTVDILRLATTIPKVGRLPEPDGTSERRSPVCGSRITVDVRVDGEGRVTDIAQMVSACALGQASANLMARRAIGLTAPELEALSQSLGAWLSGAAPAPGDWDDMLIFQPALTYPARHGAIRLPFEAVAEAAGKAVRHA